MKKYDFTIKHDIFIDETGIERDFTMFDASDYIIDNIKKAAKLAKDLGECVLPKLKELWQKESDEKQKFVIKKTMDWIIKKTVTHPRQVKICMQEIIKKMKGSADLKKLDLPFAKIYTDLSITAILHDIGRLSEVDIKNGVILMKQNSLKKSHSQLSFEVLHNARIKKEIILAILFHEKAGVRELRENDIYKTLSAAEKIRAEFYTYALQDGDKTGNLVERAENGVTRCAEFCDPKFLQDYDYTKSCGEEALAGKYPYLKSGHLLDTMIRFVCWIYSAELKETKKYLQKIMIKVYGQIYKEVFREYEQSEVKDKLRLANTLEYFTKLEKYALTGYLNIPEKRLHVAEINKLIAEYRK